MIKKIEIAIIGLFIVACSQKNKQEVMQERPETSSLKEESIRPRYVTDTVLYDSDDPAIWVNRKAPAKSLILGTDKGDDDKLGGIFVFDLHGKKIVEKCLLNLDRPNNIDIVYNFLLGEDTVDIAVFTERNADAIRVVRLPDMQFIDGGGISVFENDSMKSPMGVALYKRQKDYETFAIVGRKNGPKDGSYLWQYQLYTEGGLVKGKVVRKFGHWSGKKEIESIAVDAKLGYVYYSDERFAVRKYYADADQGNDEISQFATEGFLEDNEGISIYQSTDSTGYVLVSDQSDNSFQIFKREGDNSFIAELPFSTTNSDGSEVSNFNFGDEFPEGIFVAMADDKTFQIYDWRDIQKRIDAKK